MKLRSRRSVVSRVPETEPPADERSRITFVLYAGTLLALFGMAAYLVTDHMLHFEVEGRVHTTETTIATPRAGRLAALTVEAGDTVEAGQALARIDPPDVCSRPDVTAYNRARAERRQTLLALRQARARRDSLRAATERLARRATLELETWAPAERRALADERLALDQRIEALTLEAELLAERMDALAGTPDGDPRCEPFTLSAPHAGVVGRLHQPVHMAVGPRDPILTIREPRARVRVRAYLSPEDWDDVPVGSEVTVVLPDGSRGTGRVERTYSAAEEVGVEPREGYRPLPAVLVAEIRATSAAQAALWRSFDRLTVAVRGRE